MLLGLMLSHDEYEDIGGCFAERKNRFSSQENLELVQEQAVFNKNTILGCKFNQYLRKNS